MGAAHPIDWISTSPVFYSARRARMWRSKRSQFPEFASLGDPVEVEDNVWIGDDVVLGHGVKIGTGAIVASRSIVTKDVPPYAIVAGAPAKITRYVHNENKIQSLLASKWWKWPVNVWDQTDPRDIDGIVALAQELRETTPIRDEKRHRIIDLLRK